MVGYGFRSACVTAVASVLHNLSVHDHVLRQESSESSDMVPGAYASATLMHSSMPGAAVRHLSRNAPIKVARDVHAIASTAGSFLFQSILRALSCLPFAVVIERKAVVLHHRLAAGGVSLAGTQPTHIHLSNPFLHTLFEPIFRLPLTHFSRIYPSFVRTHLFC